MNKTYFIAPILALGIFVAIFVSEKSKIDQKEHDKKAAALAIKKQKEAEEVEARNKAYADAIALTEKRKKEKEARDAEEAERKQFRQSLIDARDLAYGEQSRQAAQVKKIQDEIRAETEAIEKVRKELATYQKDIENQTAVVKKTQANQKYYEQVLAKIEAAEQARAAAEKAAAEAAAKKNS